MKFCQCVWRLALAGLLVAMTWQVYNLRNLPGWTERQVRREGDATRAAAMAVIADTRKDLLGEIGSLRRDTMARIDSIESKTDERTGEVVEIARQTESDARDQLAAANRTFSATASSINTLSARYVEIPDQLANVLRPGFDALEPEITCRHLDGSGYGGCWHSRVTGLLGEATNVGGVFVKGFPQLYGSVNGIAADVHKFTSKATAPRGFWGTTKDIIVTGSGITRAASAAGLF